MDFDKLFDNLGKIVPKVIVQIAEKINFNLNLNFKIELFGKYIQPNFPEKADPKKIADTELPKLIEQNEEKIIKHLTKHKDYIITRPENEVLQFIADSTATVISGVLDASMPVPSLEASGSTYNNGEAAVPFTTVAGTRSTWPPDDSGETM